MSQVSLKPPTSSQTSDSKLNAIGQINRWLYSLWKFSRPHTIIGTSLSVLALYLIALSAKGGTLNNSLITSNLLPLGLSWIACICGNIYIVGLNQLEDVEIDQINKPHLPIAAGEFSRLQAQIIVAIAGILSLLFAWIAGPFLLLMVSISLAIGTAYSLPPIRLKRFPFLAALCILSVRGTIVNLGLFLHFSWVWQQPLSIAPEAWAITAFILIFTIAIAIFKDIPDIDGDRHYNINTFTIKMGSQAVFNLSRWILTACYLGMIIAAIFWLPSVNQIFLVSTHLVGLGLMWWQSLGVDLQDKTAITKFYQFIWKLFFWEYLIFPAACLLS